ncbi:MAG: ECF transporter S component [Clostridia bacterium]|nr:ECF transporter S component [Clostridia bacterium]
MNHKQIVRMATLAILTAIVVVLQLLGSFIRFGPFSVSLVLVPIAIGAALYGMGAGTWLGFVFGMAVLLSGDAAAFLTINVPGTIITVLAKGMLAGLAAGFIHKLLVEKNSFLAVAASAIACPLVNTGVFLIGCVLFFLPTIAEWGLAEGFDNVAAYLIVGMVGFNFLFEMLVNVVLTPAIVRILKVVKITRR